MRAAYRLFAGASAETIGGWPPPFTWRPLPLEGRLRVDGRFFLTAAGATFRWTFADALSILARSEADARRYLDWVAERGFNGVRVFCGTLGWAGQTLAHVYDRLPQVLAQAASRGLYVEVTAITGSAEGWDVVEHLQRINSLVTAFPNAVVELANEPYHPSQSPHIQSPTILADLRMLIGSGIPVALGAAADDEALTYRGGNYITAHLDRSRDKWNMVRRVRELENVSAITRKPVINNEPIKAGSQQADPAIFYTMGVLNRLFEVGGVFHADHGLRAEPPDAAQQALVDAFLAGSHAIPVDDRLRFYNCGWQGSPVHSADFNAIVRAYTGVNDAGTRAWTVLVGITGDPALHLQHGWQLVSAVAPYPGVEVWALQR